MFAKCAAAAAFCLIAALIPAQATACMTYAEARQMFRTSHLYWHGKDHCWDSSRVAAKRASIGRPVRRPESRASSVAVATELPNEVAKISLLSSPANSEQPDCPYCALGRIAWRWLRPSRPRHGLTAGQIS
jgi:hypothetical protein